MNKTFACVNNGERYQGKRKKVCRSRMKAGREDEEEEKKE